MGMGSFHGQPVPRSQLRRFKRNPQLCFLQKLPPRIFLFLSSLGLYELANQGRSLPEASVTGLGQSI